MKAKKLIELLQEFGDDVEVCMPTVDGNVDILYLELKEGYWDGAYQVLERDWSDKFYNVTGAKYRSDGYKIVIIPHSIQDMLADEPDFPVEVIDTFVSKQMQKQVDKWRQEAIDINAKVEKWEKERKENKNNDV